MGSLLKEFIQAFSLIFLAEMGDKSQLIALAFATTYPIGMVLLGVSLGIALNHGLAIIFAYFISKYMGSMTIIHVFAGLLFLYFGFSSMTLNYEEEDEKEIKGFGPIITMAATFFIGEFGDKTQLTAMTLALDSSRPLLIFVATVSSMISVSLIGILVGKVLGKKIPEMTMRILAGILFIIFGLSKLWETLPPEHQKPIFLILGIVISIGISLYILRKNKKRRDHYYLKKLNQSYSKCKQCETHNPMCPVGMEIEKYSTQYIGEKIPYLGKILSHIEKMKSLDKDRYADLLIAYYKKI